MKTTGKIFLIFFLFTFLLTALFRTAVAEENLEDILNGFEDTSDTKIDDVLDGFEDKPEDDDDLQDIMDGFEASEISRQPTPDDNTVSFLELDGYLSHDISFNFTKDAPAVHQADWRGLSQFRTELQLELNIELPASWDAFISGKAAYDFAYELKGRREFTDDVIDDEETELEFREVFIRGRLTRKLDIKIGRQIVVWGKSDNIRVTDVVNPLDMREPGVTDIEDLRLPVMMTRIDYALGSWFLTGLAIHEMRFNKNAAYGSDFNSHPPIAEDKPSDGIDHTEFALSLEGFFSGWDFALYFADIYDDTPHIEGYPPVLKHSRIKMAGTAINIAMGNWLFKSEAAVLDGLAYSSEGDYTRADILAGVEYSGFSETTISIEAVNRHIFDGDALSSSQNRLEEDRFQSVFRITRDFYYDTLTLTFLASIYGLDGKDGAFQRFTAEYDINDMIKISGGGIFYQSGDLPGFENMGDNDRVFMEIRYSF